MDVSLLYLLDLIGTFAFAISGCLHAAKKNLDLFGVFITAFLTALGGGTTRDILLGNTPVSWLNDTNYILIIFIAVVICFFMHKILIRLSQTLFLFDAIGIAVFTIIGIRIALEFNITISLAISMGVVTAVFGGILRDVFLNQVPLILKKEIYATACLLGGILYVILEIFVSNHDINLLITILFIIMIRILAVKYKISIPVLKSVQSEENEE